MTGRARNVNGNGNTAGSGGAAALDGSAGTLERRGTLGGAPTSGVGGLALTVPAEWLDALADLVADRLSVAGDGVSPWLDRPGAAGYLGVTLSRLEKDRTVPCHRWDGRVLYHRGELDGWLLGMGPR